MAEDARRLNESKLLEANLADTASGLNPFCPLYFPFAEPRRYQQLFGTRHHTTGQGLSDGSHGPVARAGHTYNDKEGTSAALFVSKNGQVPHAVQQQQVEMLKKLSKCSAVKVGGWSSGMKDLDFYHSIWQISGVGEKEFYDKYQSTAFTMKDGKMRSDYLKALVRVLDPLVDGILASVRANEKVVVHWDGDELWDVRGKRFDNYAPMVWALAANLHRRGRLEALLAVKNARTKWSKAIGSEPEGSAEDEWYRSQRDGANGTPREAFAMRYFRESKIDDMLGFIQQYSQAPVPDMVCLTHSTEKNRFVSERQDGSKYGYFGASVQSAMAQGIGAQATVVMLGGGDVIYHELSNRSWTGTAAADKETSGYKAGTKVLAFDVLRKEQTQRCNVFTQEGEPEAIFTQEGEEPKLKGRMMVATAVFNKRISPVRRNEVLNQRGQSARFFEGGVRHFSFWQDVSDPLKNVVVTAYASRGKLFKDMKSYVYMTCSTVVSMPGRVSTVVHNPKIHAVMLEEEDPEALAAVVSGAGAALCLGSIGAVVGTSLGGAAGTLIGIFPFAFFTLGLSVPVGLVLGSMGGLCVGLSVGGSVGFIGGAVSGCTIAYYRVVIRNTANGIVAKVDYAYDKLVRQPTLKVKSVTRSVCNKTKTSAVYTKESAVALASSKHAQVTAASAAVGATALGTAGAAGGALAGGASGALLGLIPALFTFGLSIPAGAAVGGGMGLCVGGAAGASTGFVGGAVAGYTGFAYRSAPASAANFVLDKWNGVRGVAVRDMSSSGGTEDAISE